MTMLCVQLVALPQSAPKIAALPNLISFFPSAVDPSCLWMPATIRQRVGRADIWLQHMDHSSQFCYSFEPFLPHALGCLPLRGVPPGLTE